MIKACSLIVFLFLCLEVFGQNNQTLQFSKIYAYALQEDVQKIISVLDTLPVDKLTDEQREVKEKYYRRFKYQNEEHNYITIDPKLNSLLKLYQYYWRNVLLNQEKTNQYNEQLKVSVIGFLREQGYKADTLSEQEYINNFGLHLKIFLKQQAYYAATGKTGNLYDLFIWPKQDTVTYHVQLPEITVETKIIFIENPVTMGWQEYATFGRSYPGGWATKEFLYCVKKAYDLEGENFKVSYLTHEAQHFADYKTFPKLTGADLEYRAKLTELVYAQKTLPKLMQVFIRNGNKEGRNAHGFANYAVVRNLSGKILKQEFVSDLEVWKKVSEEKISKTSRKLLKRHSKTLRKRGQDKVVEYIK